MAEQKDRFESTEPETDDVEGHRLAKDDPERRNEADRNLASPTSRHTGDMDRDDGSRMRIANADRNDDRNID